MKKFLLLQACEFAKYNQYEDAKDSDNELYSISENENFFKYQVNQTNKLLSYKYEMKIERINEEFEKIYRQKDKHCQNINNQLNASIDKFMESERKLRENLQESQEEIIQRDSLIEDYKASKRKLKDENEQLKDF